MNAETIATQICDVLADQVDVIAVYLFGSLAEGKAHGLSDIDVAVLFQAGMSDAQIYARTLAIGSCLEPVLATSVDVVALNRAPPFLCFQVVRKGKLLLERDRTERCLFQMRTMSIYYDVKPYLDYQRREAICRMRDKGFGHGYQGHRNALTEIRSLRAALARSEARAAP